MAAHYYYEGQLRREKGMRRRATVAASNPLPEDEIEPRKVYVGNLRVSVTDYDLKDALSHYANVLKAFTIKDKHFHRSKGYGFVEVATPTDVKQLLALKGGDRYINGQEMVIRPARKKTMLPGDVDYVIVPISDRPFDLEAEDPATPCIHVLVDDVMYKILEILPLKTLIGVERVCRRWQILVHKLFARRKSLNLSEHELGLYYPLTRTIVRKLLMLSGPTLKELKVQNVDYSTRLNILRIIAQLCPELQSLDVTQTMGVNFSNLRVLAKGCRNLKTFIAANCPDFNHHSLTEVLLHYPDLEQLNIDGWLYNGKEFLILPSTLRELKISNCKCITPNNLKLIGDRCPNLEILNMSQVIETNCIALECIGTKCTKLKELTVSITHPDLAEGLRPYKKLKVLQIDVYCWFDIFPVIEHMTDLEDFSLMGLGEDMTSRTMLNFSVFKKLKNVVVLSGSINTKSLKTLSKCVSLRSLKLVSYGKLMTPTLFLDILRGCPEMVKFSINDLVLTAELVKSIDDIMKSRTGPITIVMILNLDVTEDDYDSKKIKFELSGSCQIISDGSDDGTYDSEDCYDDDDLLLSEDSFEEYWFYGYDYDTNPFSLNYYQDSDSS